MITSCMVLLLGFKIFLLLILLKVFQKELGKRTGTVQVLKRSGRELIENSRDDTTWVKGQLQELSTRWDTVCKLSVSKQSRLEQALTQVRDVRWGKPQGFQFEQIYSGFFIRIGSSPSQNEHNVKHWYSECSIRL